MAGDYPVQNSEVYLMGSSHIAAIPPPSPPSSATPCERALSPPIEDFMSMTPPEVPEDYDPSATTRLQTAVHVLATEATALSCLTRLYETNPVARAGFNSAVEAITRFDGDKGKLVITGIGKSGHIAKKLVATMNSLKIHATYLHPTEALHGDLGKVGKHDTILFITFSGKTPELIQLLPHLDQSLPIVIMTAHVQPSTCAIANLRPDVILLPSPIHQSETESFGVSAPTTSTTIALALGDALAVAISRELHLDVSAVFSKNHPGGAIGAAFLDSRKISDLAIPFEDISEVDSSASGAHVLMAAYKSETGWIRQGKDVVIPPRRIKLLQPDDLDEPASQIKGLVVPSRDWISVPMETSMTVPSAQEWIKRQRLADGDKFNDDAILVLMDDDEVFGVMELGELL